MTSNRSFFNAGILRETMRRNIWAVALSFVGFFFCLPLPVAMTIQQFMSQNTVPLTESDHVRLIEQVQMLLGLDNVLVKTGVIIMAVLCGIALFSYLHSRQRVDFYHALPIRRGALFANNFTAGIITVVPAFVIMYALAAVLAVSLGVPEAFSLEAGAAVLLTNIVFFLLIYTVSVLAAILTGNTILAVLLNLWLMFSVAVLGLLLSALQSMFLQTYRSSGFMEKLLDTSPIILYFKAGSSQFSDTVSQTAASVFSQAAPYLLGALIYLVLVTVLNYFLFARRKSEAAGSAVSFVPLKTPLKCYMVLLLSLAFGIAISGIGGDFWIWFGLAVGTLLGHIIIEMIYHLDVRAAFAHWKTMLVLGVLSIVLVCGVKFDVLGYDTWLPKADAVEAVGIDGWFNSYSTAPRWSQTGVWSTEPKLTDPAAIEAAFLFAEAGIAEIKQGSTADAADAQHSFSNVTVYYKMKNGKLASRYYHRVEMNDLLWNALNRMRFTEEYIRIASPLFREVLDENMDSLRLDVRTHADLPTDNEYSITKTEIAREVVRTLREESLLLTSEIATTTVPVLRIDALVQPNHWSGYYSEEFIPVYPTYTRTLALLAQYGIVPQPLTADLLSSITLEQHPASQEWDAYYAQEQKMDSARPYGGPQSKTVEITDPAEIEALLQNAVTESVSNSCDISLRISGHDRYNVVANFKSTINGDRTTLYYLGDFPESLCASYF